MRASLTVSSIACAALLSACLQDVTVGFDTQRLVDEGSRDGGSKPDAAVAERDASPSTMLDAEIVIAEAGSDLDAAEPATDAGPCAPSDCEPPNIQIAQACDSGEAPVCSRDSSGICALLCPDAPDLRCGGVHLVPGKATSCGADTYCRLDVGSCDFSLMGTCDTRPVDCPKDSEPVCSCDGATYNNPCEAARDGKSLKSLGACP